MAGDLTADQPFRCQGERVVLLALRSTGVLKRAKTKYYKRASNKSISAQDRSICGCG